MIFDREHLDKFLKEDTLNPQQSQFVADEDVLGPVIGGNIVCQSS